MKTMLGMGLITLALLAGCQTKSANVAPIQPVTPAPVAQPDPYDKPYVAVAPPSNLDVPTIPIDTPAPKGRTPTSAKPVTPTAKTPVTKATTTYVVKKGDTLSAIAKAKYGNANQYTKIVKANPGLDPNKIKVGQKLNLPA